MFRGRALYNLLQISAQEGADASIEEWKVCDYRKWQEEQLWDSLSALGIELSPVSFLAYVENVDSPEELVEYLWVEEEDLLGEEKVYLLVFELWRRLVSNKRSISIFFDELDRWISAFDAGKLLPKEGMQELLQFLLSLLEGSGDFIGLCSYAAHDIAGFLYDYLVEDGEEGDDALAWVEAFLPYMPEKKWLSLLRWKAFVSSDLLRARAAIVRLIEEEEELPFLQEVCLIAGDDVVVLVEAMKKMSLLLQTRQDIEAMGELVADLREISTIEGPRETLLSCLQQAIRKEDLVLIRRALASYDKEVWE